MGRTARYKLRLRNMMWSSIIAVAAIAGSAFGNRCDTEWSIIKSCRKDPLSFFSDRSCACEKIPNFPLQAFLNKCKANEDNNDACEVAGKYSCGKNNARSKYQVNACNADPETFWAERTCACEQIPNFPFQMSYLNKCKANQLEDEGCEQASLYKCGNPASE